jgi:epoxyqueuosine reductase
MHYAWQAGVRRSICSLLNYDKELMMVEDLTTTIHEKLKQNGWQGKIVSVDHVEDLEKEIEAHHQNGLLDQELYDGYLNRFDFNVSAYFEGAQTLIVVTAPQTQQRVEFNWQGQTHACIIPPTYSLATDHQIKGCLEDILVPQGYRLEKKRLPEKLLAVHSGLTRYGKNNITYVPGMGSFHRPAVFVTDMPSEEDSWGEPQIIKACHDCSACAQACPTDAIVSERFLVHAERCITFQNERPVDFPQWLDPSWHNSLVGCMFCQTVCPMNTNFQDWIEDGATFSEEETAFFLNDVAPEKMSEKAIAKLQQLGMLEYADVLGRNLKAILENQ